jgi:beta-phosphoglucomutase-like phosphatase (HAD superfamily)
VAQGKPAPDLFLHAAATLGAVPERCVVVEDSPFGVTAAVSAGMRCLAFAGGLTPASRLNGLGATLFHHPAALPDLIDALR